MNLFDFEKKDTPSTYRKRALQEYGAICSMCGYSYDVKMLDVHHIDENRKNGKVENLEIRCLWCHGIETRKAHWHPWNGSDFSKTGNLTVRISESEYEALKLDKKRLDYLDSLAEEKEATWHVIALEKGDRLLPKIREVVDKMLS